MARKVCLITGATSGLGLATSQALAQRGATIDLAAADRLWKLSEALTRLPA